MTQEELDALPEIPASGIEQYTVVRDGKTIVYPVVRLGPLLWQDPGDPMRVIDSVGQVWDIGRHKGQLVKRRDNLS